MHHSCNHKLEDNFDNTDGCSLKENLDYIYIYTCVKNIFCWNKNFCGLQMYLVDLENTNNVIRWVCQLASCNYLFKALVTTTC